MTTPTKEGWYFARWRGATRQGMEPVNVMRLGGELFFVSEAHSYGIMPMGRADEVIEEWGCDIIYAFSAFADHIRGMRERLEELEKDVRLTEYGPADLSVNGPLAIIQTALRVEANTLRKLLNLNTRQYHGRDPKES